MIPMYSRKYPACINNNGYGKNIINMSIGREMQNGRYSIR